MNLIRELQECATMGQADPILTRLGASSTTKKCVETAIGLSSSVDPQQRNMAYSFMESAIRELEDKDKKFHKDDDNEIKEEELTNNNNGSRERGSEQSTQNEEPYTGEGKDTTNGEKPMQDMDDTENQMKEGMMPGMGQGMPPQNMMPPGPGLAPDIAQEMGQQMPPPPDMNTNQMMRQMQYTINDAIIKNNQRFLVPMGRTLKTQRETIHRLERQLQESSTNKLELNLDGMKHNAPAALRETIGENMPSFSIQPTTTFNRENTKKAHAEIEQMDKILNSNKNSMYN